ncbi:hypothetical protein [Streptomyces sp. CAU 1734]
MPKNEDEEVQQLAKRLFADPEILEPFTMAMAIRTARRLIEDRNASGETS